MFVFESFSLLLLLLLSLPSLDSVSGPHIADVNLLLPPRMTHPVEYVLQGSDGCFSWSWDHHDILSVQPEYNATSRCSTSARLISIAPYGGRKETAVYAADLNTGTVVRCKVFIDQISRIQIFHNSVKLDLDGLATLRVRAFDAEENVFSSLVGLQFKWQLVPEDEGGIHHLVHVPLKESPLSDCAGFCGDLDIQVKLEDSGVFSDLYVVKGTEIGHETVSVNLMEPHFEHMADKIVLTVAEAMSIDPPSPLYVIVGASVCYSLRVIRQNTPQAIVLPSPHHRWSVINSSVARVDSLLGRACAVNLGITTVAVEDTRVLGHVQFSSLHVVTPDTLYLYKLPLTTYGDPVDGVSAIPSGVRWYVIAGRQYAIDIKVFTHGPDAHEIYLTEDDDVKLRYNESAYWKVFSVSDGISAKHSWPSSRILKATSQGLGRLSASLAYYSGQSEAAKVLMVMQEIMVCSRVEFEMGKTNKSQMIHLPWVPGVYQEVELKATGGCGETTTDYKWYSSDATIVYVSASGAIQAKRPGQAIIKVVSAFDLMNYNEVIVKVLIPSSMVMLQNFAVETVVDTYLEAAVTLKAPDGSCFYSCDSFNSIVRWSLRSESFKIINTTRESTFNRLQDVTDSESRCAAPCAWTHIYAFSVGRAVLHATLPKELLYSNLPPSGFNVLKASSLIAAYHPLSVQQAGNGNQFGGYWVDLPGEEAETKLRNLNEVYLVPGTQLDVILFGGPERWDDSVSYVEDVDIFAKEYSHSNDGILVDQASTSIRRLYRISCLTLGNFAIVFSCGNLIGDNHPVPAIEKVELSLICTFPSSITLLANEHANTLDLIQSAAQADRSPGRVRTTPITVANGCTIRVAAVGIHESGKAFANSSSLNLKWELNGCNGLAYWKSDGLARSRANWEKYLILLNASGLCTVRASVVGFSEYAASHLYAKVLSELEMSKNIITDAILLQLVSSLKIFPEYLLMLFNHDAKANLSIAGGTCILDAVVNDTQVVEVVQPPTSLQCLHVMLSPRGLGTALITLNDIGLSPPLAASAVVEVADVDWIKIISEEEMSLMDGSEKSLDISAGIHGGSVFDSSQYSFMNIHVHVEDSVLEVVDMHVSSLGASNINVPKIVIRAKHIGVTTLYVSARQQSGHEILSQPVKVEVYAPPRIHPVDIFLAPGASYMLTLKGGPTVGVFVEYDSMDHWTAEIDRSSGRLSAISPGDTTIRAVVYGRGDTVICEAKGRVRVGIPSSMSLNVQSDQLSVGREMPVFPSLPEGNLFSFYELCSDYKWSIEDEQVLRFQRDGGLLRGDQESQFSGTKKTKLLIHSDERDVDFINVVRGRSAGRTTVHVSFSCNFLSSGTSQSRSYNASASLLVVPYPPLALGVPVTWILPPYYTTSSLLPATSDSYNHKGTITYSLLKSHSGKSEEAQQDAISIIGSRIRTMESDTIGCILAKDRTTGRTEIGTCIKVAEVNQIRVDAESSFHAVDIVVGSELELVTKYYDSLGNPFHEAYGVVPFNTETNYPDIVAINEMHEGNRIITLKAMRQGRALIRISINNYPQKSDYIMISVGTHLHPHNPVIDAGHHLNFSIEGLKDPVSGRWSSVNRSVITVDVLSGKAYAIEEGTTQVIFEGANLKLQTTVTVQGVDLVLVDSPAGTLTNVPFPTKGYQFPVKFCKFESMGNSSGIHFDCSVDPSFVGYAKPWRDLDTGTSYCLFFPYSPEHLAYFTPKSKAMRPDISVSVRASLRDAEHVMGSSNALFVGGFSILDMGKDVMQLNLTPDSGKSIITVVGNTDVEVRWLNKDHMLITPVRKDDFGIGGRIDYEVEVLRQHRFKDKIIITLPATGQRMELGVSYEPGKPLDSISNELVSIPATLLVVIVTGFIIVKCFRNNPEVPTRTESIAAPYTPPRNSSPSSDARESPRTPQPFIEYVRRTIDETPYYKHNARRRFDPLKTL